MSIMVTSNVSLVIDSFSGSKLAVHRTSSYMYEDQCQLAEMTRDVDYSHMT